MCLDKVKVFCVLACLIMTVSFGFCGDWAQWRGPHFDGSSDETGLAGDFDNVNTSFWYYIDYYDSWSVELYAVDVVTGVSALIAPVTGLTAGHDVTGMACDKLTGVMYVSSSNYYAETSNLYTINLTDPTLNLYT